MANSDFYRILVPGGKNGGNSRTIDLLKSDALPWAFSPELTYSRVVTWRDLRDATGVLQIDELVIGGTIVAGDHSITFTDARTGAEIVTLTHAVHEDTITIAGTASDGNYDAIFDSVGVRARVVRDTTPASNDDIATELAAQITDLIPTTLAGIVASAAAVGAVVTVVYEDGIEPQTITTAETTATGTITASVASDEDVVAAALEALIEAARGADEPLEDYVDDEAAATDTVTIEYVAGVQMLLTTDIPATGTGAVTSAVTGTIALAPAGDLFPANVWVNGESGGAGLNVTTAFDGITTMTGELGDADAVAGLTTASDLLTAGFYSTIAAAEYAEHMVTADGPFTLLTAGQLEALIPYSAPASI
jgi:hypothetical protein